MNFFISAIGTDSGKTLASAIVTQALHADYWKPLQAGFPTDSNTVKSLLSNETSRIHPELFVLDMPASPNIAAAAEGLQIDLHQFRLPTVGNHLVVEGAGGLMVPFNDKDVMIDIPQYLGLEIILVCNIYLGCINHSLLSINEIKRRNVRVRGIIFNGEENKPVTDFIATYAAWPVLLHIPKLKEVNAEIVAELAEQIRPSLLTAI